MVENITIPLCNLPIGANAKVVSMTVNGAIRRRMLDLGFIKGTNVVAVRKSPADDPVAYKIRGTTIALRQEEAANIFVQQSM